MIVGKYVELFFFFRRSYFNSGRLVALSTTSEELSVSQLPGREISDPFRNTCAAQLGAAARHGLPVLGGTLRGGELTQIDFQF